MIKYNTYFAVQNYVAGIGGIAARILFCIFMTNTAIQGQYYTSHHIAPAPWQYWSNANEIVISNPGTTPATVEIRKSDSTLLATKVISIGSPFVFRPTESPASLPRHPIDKVLTGAGLLVKSTQPVSVNVRNVASDQLGSDANIKGNASLTSFGDAGIGTEFRVGYYRDENGPNPVYSVLALTDNTIVTVEKNRQYKLKKGESILFAAPTGSLVETSAPCVMNTGAFLDAPGGCGDGTFDQIPPVAVLGSRYFIVRTKGNNINEQSAIVAAEDNVTLTITKYGVNGNISGSQTSILQKAGDFIRIPNGDGSTPSSVAEVQATGKIAIYVGSAQACEVDISTSFPVSSACNGSNYVETTPFITYFQSPLPYFGYVLLADTTAKVFVNGNNLEQTAGPRIKLGSSGWQIIHFSNSQIGNPPIVQVESTAKLNVAIIQIGGGFSMSATFSSFIAQPPTPNITNVTINPCEGNFATLVADSTAEEVQWYFEGIEIPGATERTYLATSSGNYSITALQSCGERTSSAPVSVILHELESPTTNKLQTFCFDATIADLEATADSIQWYLHPDGGTPLPDSIRLVNGAFYFVSQTVNGCESVARARTQVFIKKLLSEVTVTACNEFIWNDSLYTKSGQFLKTFFTTDGCDSISSLNLTMYRDTITYQSETMCDSYVWAITGEKFNQSGHHTASYKTINGCDSIYHLNLTIHPYYRKSENKQACDSLYWPVNQQTYYQNAEVEVVFPSQTGCDSTYALDLKIHPSYQWKQEITVCDSFLWEVTGQKYSKTGDYFVREKTTFGCDSTYSLHLNVHASFTSDTTLVACDSLRWWANNQWLMKSGQFTLPYQTLNGCDSVYTLDLKIHPSFRFDAGIAACDTFFWPVTGLTYTTTGKYHFIGKTINQCDSIYTLDIQISPSFHDTLVVDAVDEFIWEVNNQVYLDSGVYILETNTLEGCDSIHILDLRLRKSNKYTWPNIISTNRDNVNDRFTIYNIQNLALIRELDIYDRWGNKVATFADLPPSRPELGWDGSFRNQSVVPGVFAFTALLEFTDKSTERIKGDISVLR
jgi:gliding motility-associated-like protein